MIRHLNGNWNKSQIVVVDGERPGIELLRKVARLILYKMANNRVMMSTRYLLVRTPGDLRSMSPHAFIRISTHQHQTNSFLPRTVADWNALPCQNISSLEAFKASVMKHLDKWCSTSFNPPLFSFSTSVFSLYSHTITLFPLFSTHSQTQRDGPYLPSYLCQFFALHTSSYQHMFISFHPVQPQAISRSICQYRSC